MFLLVNSKPTILASRFYYWNPKSQLNQAKHQQEIVAVAKEICDTRSPSPSLSVVGWLGNPKTIPNLHQPPLTPSWYPSIHPSKGHTYKLFLTNNGDHAGELSSAAKQIEIDSEDRGDFHLTLQGTRTSNSEDPNCTNLSCSERGDETRWLKLMLIWWWWQLGCDDDGFSLAGGWHCWMGLGPQRRRRKGNSIDNYHMQWRGVGGNPNKFHCLLLLAGN